jgi:hypothetical protein
VSSVGGAKNPGSREPEGELTIPKTKGGKRIGQIRKRRVKKNTKMEPGRSLLEEQRKFRLSKIDHYKKII